LAKSHTIPVAVKCGGHSPGGASSSDGGIVIDLGLMNSVSAKADEKTILAGGGALWRDVTRVASEYGLSCGKTDLVYCVCKDNGD
jgi:FAD/FMN-containing dehydrogenase